MNPVTLQSSLKGWALRGMTSGAIAASMMAGQFVQAYAAEEEPRTSTQPPVLVASASTTTFTCAAPCDHATITAYLSGVPETGFASVQWMDTANVWHNVDAWQSQLDVVAGSEVPFLQWAVLESQYGDGPFRWVIYNEEGGEIWGISPTFNLPASAATDYALFLTQPGQPFLKPGLMDQILNPIVPATAPILSADGGTTAFTCGDALCDHGDIAAFIPNAPRTAWLSVQWQDVAGAWHDVEGWQGNIDVAAGSNMPFKQWSVFSSQFGAGPFRWVVYNQRGGNVWGVSPNFNLPQFGGLKVTTFLSPSAPATTPPTTAN